MTSRKEQALKLNISRLSESLGQKHLAVADAFVSLGLYELESGESNLAEASFRQALSIRVSAIESTDETVTQIHYYLGLCHCQRGNFDAARQEYEYCLDNYENECRPEDAFLATVLDTLATLHQTQDEYCLAESYLKRSLFIRLCVLEPFDAAIAESLTHLGWLYSQCEQYQRAESLFLSALDIWISHYGLKHVGTALCLENYAYVLRKTGRDKEANQLLQRAESIRLLHVIGPA